MNKQENSAIQDSHIASMAGFSPANTLRMIISHITIKPRTGKCLGVWGVYKRRGSRKWSKRQLKKAGRRLSRASEVCQEATRGISAAFLRAVEAFGITEKEAAGNLERFRLLARDLIVPRETPRPCAGANLKEEGER